MLEQILDSLARQPTLGVVGIASQDTVLATQTMPASGGFAIIDELQILPGGTSANAAVTAAKLGAQVDFISTVGNDESGRQLLEHLAAAGVDISRVGISTDTPTDHTTVITTRDPANRTLFWQQGAIPRLGDRLDIDRLFTRQLVLLDSVDPGLRRFLIDLPVHTFPDVKILVPMTYVIDFPGRDEFESIIRCDALVGSEHELKTLTGVDSLRTAIAAMQRQMRTANVRQVAITRGEHGALAFDTERIIEVPAIEVDAVDTTGAGDAFTGAFAIGLATRLDLPAALHLANCVAGLSVRALGAQSALPTTTELEPVLRSVLT